MSKNRIKYIIQRFKVCCQKFVLFLNIQMGNNIEDAKWTMHTKTLLNAIWWKLTVNVNSITSIMFFLILSFISIGIYTWRNGHWDRSWLTMNPKLNKHNYSTCVNRNVNLGVGKESEQRAGRENSYGSNKSTIITSDCSLRIMVVADQSQSSSYSPLRIRIRYHYLVVLWGMSVKYIIHHFIVLWELWM